MIRQYRHPVGRQLWEIPAGLRDVAGEALVADTARRELLEETGLPAPVEWHALVDYYTSPGFTSERIRIFLARGLEPPADDRQPARGQKEKFLRHRLGAAGRGGAAGAGGEAAQRRHYPGRPGRGHRQLGGFSGLRPADAPES